MPPKRKITNNAAASRKKTRTREDLTKEASLNESQGKTGSATAAPITSTTNDTTTARRGRNTRSAVASKATRTLKSKTDESVGQAKSTQKRKRSTPKIVNDTIEASNQISEYQSDAEKVSKTKGKEPLLQSSLGRPRNINSRIFINLPKPKTVKDSDTDEIDSKDAGKGKDEQKLEQYWLLKAEPNDRFENGHNVKFSIDDLAAASRPEPWDGVRNYVARNNMRSMRKGDLAFFYHSNCTIPGIVGVMQIVEEHSIDESAFNPKHPYYDPKSSREKPKWDVVHVRFIRKFDKQITLKDINTNAATTRELAEMDLLKYKRLSVTAVKPREWRFILEMAGESDDF